MEVEPRVGEKLRSLIINKNTESHQEENYFDRLPDHLILLIINKIVDATTLTRFSLASKRFSPLVSHANTVSCAIKVLDVSQLTLSFVTNDLCKSLLFNLAKDLLDLPPRVFVADSNDYTVSYKLCDLLKNFLEIKHLQIELHLPSESYYDGCDINGESFFKWKAMFGSQFQCCSLLFATSCHKTNSSASNSNSNSSSCNSSSSDPEGDDDKNWPWIIPVTMKIASLMHKYVRDIIYDHRMLRSVVISDSRGWGKVCMGEEEIVKLRSDTTTIYPRRRDSFTKTGRWRLVTWEAPVLDLPSLGYTLEGVILCEIQPVDQSLTQSEDVFSTFDDKEWGVYEEAVKKIVGNNNTMAACEFYCPKDF